MRRRRLLRLLPVVPFGLLVAHVRDFGVDVPWWDEWQIVELVDLDRRGLLRFSNLWSQHNEHRPVMPRLVMIGLARFSDWDTRWEMAASVLLAVALLAILVWALSASDGVTLFAAATVFSLGQWENWIVGWQIQILLSVAAAAFGFALIAWKPPRWNVLLLALAGGAVALYSFANGALFFPIGVILLWRTRAPRRAPILFGLGGLAITLPYFIGYTKPPAHPPLTLALSHVGEYILFCLTYLGNPMVQQRVATPIVGGVGLLLAAEAGRRLRRRAAVDHRPILFACALGAYALLSGLLAGLGRLGIAWSAGAFAPRYVTIAGLFWLGLAGIWSTVLVDRPRIRVAAAAVAIAVVSVRSLQSRSELITFSHQIAEGRQRLISLRDEGLEVLHPDPRRIVREWRPLLQKHQLSAFR